MGPTSLPDRKYSGRVRLPCIEAESGDRKAGGDGWEDQLEKSLEAQIEAKSVVTDKKELIICFSIAQSKDSFPGLPGSHLGLFLSLTPNTLFLTSFADSCFDGRVFPCSVLGPLADRVCSLCNRDSSQGFRCLL